VARGHRTLEERGITLVASLVVNEVHLSGWFEHLWNMRNLSGNFMKSGTHPRVVVAVGWRVAVGVATFDGEERLTTVDSGASGLLHYGGQETNVRQKPKGKEDGQQATLTGRGSRWQPWGRFRRGAASPGARDGSNGGGGGQGGGGVLQMGLARTSGEVRQVLGSSLFAAAEVEKGMGRGSGPMCREGK
jgi:hypothetical protein